MANHGSRDASQPRMNTRRLPVPLLFASVISSMIFLFIFFGAWAVSASADGRELSVSLGLANNDVSPSASASGSFRPIIDASTDETAGNSPEETWWGKALLMTCPLH